MKRTKIDSPNLTEGKGSNPIAQTKDANISALLMLRTPPQVAIYEPSLEHDSFGQSQAATAVHFALVQYLSGWFGFPTLKLWTVEMTAKILIVDDINLPSLLASRPDIFAGVSRQNIIILCSNPASQADLSKDLTSKQVELICKPFGPHKLARALCRALKKVAKLPTNAELVQIDSSAVDPRVRTLVSRTPTKFDTRAGRPLLAHAVNEEDKAIEGVSSDGQPRVNLELPVGLTYTKE